MKIRIFTLMMAFLATLSGEVWAETNPNAPEDSPYDLATRGGLKITDSRTYYVYSSSETNNGITINGGLGADGDITPTIYLDGININVSGEAISIQNYSKPTFVIRGENVITSQGFHELGTISIADAAINIGLSARLTISDQSTGILDINMTSQDEGRQMAIGNAAIDDANCGSLYVEGGTIKTNGRLGRFDLHGFRLQENAVVIAQEIKGFTHNDEKLRAGGLLYLNGETIGEFHNAVDDPEFTLNSPLPEPYKIEIREGGVEVTIGEGQSLEESQVDLLGGTLNAYKVSYESPENLAFGVTLPATKYHGPKYTTESLSEAKATYQLGTYALLTTNLWETVASNSTWAEAGKKQDKKDVSTGITEVKYSLVGTLTEKELNLKTDEGLTTEFSLWYPTSLNITATEEDASDDENLSTYGMQMTKGIVQKSTPFTALTETTETQEVQINLSALPSVSAIDPAILT